MSVFLQSIVFGVFVGSIYSLVALGYTMVYGVLKFINFAHGDVFMWGAYFFYLFSAVWGLGVVPGVVLAVLCCGVLGVVVERVAYRPLRFSSRLAPLITAIGVSLLLESVAQLRFTAAFVTLTGILGEAGILAFLESTVVVFGARVAVLDLLILSVSLVLMFLLHFFVRYSRMGKAMRAVADDLETASVVGINVDRVIAVTFLLGSMLAGVGGILYGLKYAVNPYMGVLPGIKAFTAAVVGGIGNIYGAMAGGILIGLAENLGVTVLPSVYRDGISFLILILFLVFRPQGLLGKTEREV